MAQLQDAAAGAARQSTWTAGAARDRLSSTTFLAALFHGILILGISFTAGAPDRDSLTSTMEVVLVTGENEDRAPPEGAVLLAQQNLAGAGNTTPEDALLTAPGLPLPAPRLGPARDGGEREARPGLVDPVRQRQQLLLARDAELRAPDAGDPEHAPQVEASMLPSPTSAIDIVGRLDTRTLVPDSRPRELLISANTRESRIAGYLNTWKRKVEQVGTLNFPFSAHVNEGARYPVLEVAIGADGRLRDVVVQSSSGQARLDQAAMDILRLASPFEPFPETLRADYDVLRFAYEWRFSEGSARVRARTAAAF
ncbi:MAG: TonB family protein [Gammaproteobacteria bacterium]|nr:TonB family protein [Gammaproteobacteria bacterium]